MSQEIEHNNLTESEREIVIATARYNKISKIEWLSKNNLNIDVTNIDLSEDEVVVAVEKATKLKNAKIYFDSIRTENRQRERLRREELIAKWSASYFYRVMKDNAHQNNENIIYNEHTEKLIKTFCYKLSRDKRYETELGFSFSKSLLIRGNPGLGKSWIPSLVSDNPILPMQILNMHQITDAVRKTGEFNGLKFASYDLIYLDDLGTEETPVKYFGTEINWFKTWYENFYASAKNKSYRLIISTNLEFQEIEHKYGFRIRDRMAETFDVLDLTGKSMRRK